MLRFLSFAVPTLLLILALFGVVVDTLDLEPRAGSVLRLSTDARAVPAVVVLGGWIMETCGLLALFLLAQGRCGNRWLDGLVAGWLAWVFRGPIFVVTIVVATRQPQDPWWQLAFAWWILYSVCGLALAAMAPRTDEGEAHDEADTAPRDETPQVADQDADAESANREAKDQDKDNDDTGADGTGTGVRVPELPLAPGDEDPTDRHPTIEMLRAAGVDVAPGTEGSDEPGDDQDIGSDTESNVDGDPEGDSDGDPQDQGDR